MVIPMCPPSPPPPLYPNVDIMERNGEEWIQTNKITKINERLSSLFKLTLQYRVNYFNSRGNYFSRNSLQLLERNVKHDQHSFGGKENIIKSRVRCRSVVDALCAQQERRSPHLIYNQIKHFIYIIYLI